MSSKILKQTKNRTALAFATAGAVGVVSVLSIASVNADEVSTGTNGKAMKLEPNVTAGSFDLTKQAKGELTFPVVFDRPSGVNAAALAGTVTQLGSGSTLYKSALKDVPELSNTQAMNSLLSDSLDKTSPNYDSARATIVKLINWYNSLGGQKITTQAGAAYTVDNLDDPINVLAVAFSNNNSINSSATKALDEINGAKTVGDVMKALDGYQSGVSQPYQSTFDAYAKKVYADGADLNELSKYTAVKPVLDAYEGMYANGASAIRKTLIDGQATSTEAGVTFFESAVIAGSTSNGGGDDSNTNKPSQKDEYTTKWVDEDGKTLATPVTNESGYEAKKTFPNYEFVKETVDESTHTKVYVYKPVKGEVTSDTVWVDEDGNTLREKETGTFPDDGSKTLFPGYVVIKTNTTTDEDGNTHTVNTYHKVKVDTVWVDTEGKVLKEKAEGAFPDDDGKSDIPGYKLVSVKTNTDANGDQHVVNTYEKVDEPKKVVTHWVDESGKPLKPDEVGSFPDNDGESDIPGYTLVETKTDEDGNVTNIYKPIPKEDVVHTYWFDVEGNTLREKREGTFPDTDKNDIEGYTLQQIYTVTAEDIAKGGIFEGTEFKVGDTINIYEKDKKPTPTPQPEQKVVTEWVDTDGKQLLPPANEYLPDNDNKSDVPGYHIVSISEYTDENGVKHVKNIYEKDADPEPTPTPIPKPTPKPQVVTPTPETPKAPSAKEVPSAKQALPQTGEDSLASTATAVAGVMGMLGSVGLFVKNRRKRKPE